ncbi:MAG: hypothetical protein ACKUBY_05670 [Candidatus Moraniibacteriota bacterium]|jgi:type IV secretion system pilin
MIINIAQAVSMSQATPISTVLANTINFVVSIVGGIAVLMILIAGLMYMTSGGDMQRIDIAKKGITAGIVGLVVTLLSLMIVKITIGLV